MNKQLVQECEQTAAGAFGNIDHLQVAHLVGAAMGNVVDAGTVIDSGCDAESADLWLIVGGAEYYVTIQRSKRQIEKDRERGANGN